VRPALRIYAPKITRNMRDFRMRFRDEAEFVAALEAYLATIGADLNAVLRRPIRRLARMIARRVKADRLRYCISECYSNTARSGEVWRETAYTHSTAKPVAKRQPLN
jgi:hypothetical protein